MWQKCPVCNGTGSHGDEFSRAKCPACNGTGLLSTISGRPPQVYEKSSDNTIGKIIQNDIEK